VRLHHAALAASATQRNINSPIRKNMSDMIDYLRETAQTCTRLARTCPHRATSHALEEIAHDLMAKAQELERTYSE
jgi:hypothetical protein